MKYCYLVFTIIVLTAIVFQGFYLYVQGSDYVPNELLIKLKNNDISLVDILKKENIIYTEIKRLHTIVPVISKAKKDLKLGDLPDEEIFKIVYKEMNEIEKSTYRSYLISFPKNIDIEKIVLKLKNDKNIESIDKNLIMKIQKNRNLTSPQS